MSDDNESFAGGSDSGDDFSDDGLPETTSKLIKQPINLATTIKNTNSINVLNDELPKKL